MKKETRSEKLEASTRVGSMRLLAAFVKELETTATGNAEYGYRKLKKREYAAYHHANGTAKAMRWCAKKLREIQIAANGLHEP